MGRISLAHLPFVFCYAAQSLTGHGPEVVHGLDVEKLYSRNPILSKSLIFIIYPILWLSDVVTLNNKQKKRCEL